MTAPRLRAALVVGVALCFFAAVPLAAQAAAGDLDASFGTGGTVTTDVGTGSESLGSVAIQSDGKIVAGGYCKVNDDVYDFCLARYSSDGSLDTSFDGDGRVTNDFGFSLALASAMAVQSDGKIVAAGGCGFGNGVHDFCLARYSSDGSLDTSFDADGRVTTAIGFGTMSSATALAVQGDGKITVFGGCDSTVGERGFCLARYSSNGSLDTSFDSDGKVTTTMAQSTGASDMVVQSDGRIVVAGGCGALGASEFCLARYSSDGSLDTSFDSDGKVTTAISGYDAATAVVVQSDGKIVAVGGCADMFPPTTSSFCLARYSSDGSLDTSFDSDGKVTTAIGSAASGASAVAIQSDGKIVAAGRCTDTTSSFCLARYSSDGSLDTSFDSDGKVTTAIGSAASGASAVAIQSDGKIVAAGGCGAFGAVEFCLARYDGTGTGPGPVDGIDDALQPPGTPAGSFVDDTGDGKTTTGTLTSGSVTVTDAADPDGVVIVAGVAGATLTVCSPSYELVVAPGASATVTCGSVTVESVANGSVIVLIPGADVFVTFAAGSSGTVESDGGISVTGATGDVTMTVSGASGPVPAGDSTLLRLGAGKDLIYGTSGNDLIFDAGGSNTINGKGGNDTIVAGSGNDTINGGDGDDWIDAGDGKNTATGGEGNDSITAGSGNDSIDGNHGDDRIDAGDGKNTVKGGAGNDSITAGSGNDTIDGGHDYDTCTPGLGQNKVKNCEA